MALYPTPYTAAAAAEAAQASPLAVLSAPFAAQTRLAALYVASPSAPVEVPAAGRQTDTVAVAPSLLLYNGPRPAPMPSRPSERSAVAVAAAVVPPLRAVTKAEFVSAKTADLP